MKILLDMNLPPAWVDFLENQGFQAIHWSNVGIYAALLQAEGGRERR
jgi:predicted nuclease of predicted toxin-antitoxin system